MASIKHQASKNFYYGADGSLEDKLSDVEGILAALIKCICEKLSLPRKNTKDHIALLAFIAITHLRNPAVIEGRKRAFQDTKNTILEFAPATDIDSLIPNIDHESSLFLSFGMVGDVMETIKDLDYKILINKTNIPFITSDHPIVKYNQYLEQKKWPGSKTGFAMTGLQILVPLNPFVMLILYDKGIYKIGTNKQIAVEITNSKEIEQMNMLQYLNCLDTIFFNHLIGEEELVSMYRKSARYHKANVPKSSIAKLIRKHNSAQQTSDSILVMQTTDCAINMQLSCLRLHSKGKNHKLNPSMAQFRPHCSR